MTAGTRAARSRSEGGGRNGQDERTVRALLDAHRRTYAAEAGIRPRDTPQPLYRLLVLSCLLSARIQDARPYRDHSAEGREERRGPRRPLGKAGTDAVTGSDVQRPENAEGPVEGIQPGERVERGP